MTRPRLIIAGTHSGSGKTTVTMALGLALTERGLTVQPFKTGPDYIDPGFHSHATGRICRNLDSMLLSKDSMLELFHRSSEKADISIIEGVMGLFDGASGIDDRGSAASISKLSKSPVILIVDARSMARSAAAIVKGFDSMDPKVKLAGVIFNRIGSPRHYEMIKEAVQSTTDVPVLGYIPRDEEIAIPERHLGLVPSWEEKTSERRDQRLVDIVEKYLDIEQILAIANGAPAIPEYKPTIFISERNTSHIRIAIAMDEAFHFYYEDNLDILRHLGAELVPFSPLKNDHLPEDICAIYIGGGFPELVAEKLEKNKNIKREIAQLAKAGLPIYAECGGLMYLVDSIEEKDGTVRSMVSLFPGKMLMGKKLRSLGYCDGKTLLDTVIGPAGTHLKGHVFHWSSYEGTNPVYAMKLIKGDNIVYEGLALKNVLASYLHIHFASNLDIAKNFIKEARKWKKENLEV